MNGSSRQGHVAIGPLVASVGAVLLIVSLFLDWYEGITGFTVFEFLDLLLVLMALATIASLAGGLGLVRPAVSPGLSLAVAIFTVAVVVSQIVNHPPAAAGANGAGKDIGIWLGLAGGGLMVVGGLLGYAHISLAVETRRRESRPPREVGHDDPTVASPDPAAPPPRDPP